MLESLRTAATPQVLWAVRCVSAVVLFVISFELVRDYLKGGRERRLISFRWHRLTRKGFVIVSHPQAQGHWLRRLDGISKHPAVLLILGFVLTGIVGTWLTHELEQHQRDRELVARSMDDLRTSIDDLNATFSDYASRASRLISLRESKASAGEVNAARADYQAAYYKWEQRIAVDTPNILQRYPQKGDYPGVWPIVTSLRLGVGWLHSCIERGELSTETRAGFGTGQRLVCKDTNLKTTITAEDRLLADSLCIQLFATELRPNPIDDFATVPVNQNFQRLMTEQVTKICGVPRLIGLEDVTGKPRA